MGAVGFLGCDPDQLRRLARRFGGSRDELAASRRRVHNLLWDAQWEGADARSMASSWLDDTGDKFRRASDALGRIERDLRRQAREQEEVSLHDRRSDDEPIAEPGGRPQAQGGAQSNPRATPITVVAGPDAEPASQRAQEAVSLGGGGAAWGALMEVEGGGASAETEGPGRQGTEAGPKATPAVAEALDTSSNLAKPSGSAADEVALIDSPGPRDSVTLPSLEPDPGNVAREESSDSSARTETDGPQIPMPLVAAAVGSVVGGLAGKGIRRAVSPKEAPDPL